MDYESAKKNQRRSKMDFCNFYFVTSNSLTNLLFSKLIVDLFFAITSIFDLFTRLRQKIRIRKNADFFIQAAVGVPRSELLGVPVGLAYHQPLRGWISSRQRRVSHHAPACILRLDDIQHSVLMIYRNKLRMIYTPSA